MNHSKLLLNFFFRKENFAHKKQDGRFNRVASDQTIEQTINKHQKPHGRITDTTTPGTMQRCVLTSFITGQSELQVEEGVL